MVADAKRKEARKRKYAHLQKTLNVEDGEASLEALDADAPPPKKSRKISVKSATAPPAEPLPAPEETASSGSLGSITQGAAEVDSAPPAKKARFLCFVGIPRGPTPVPP